MRKIIPYSCQTITSDDIKAVVRTLQADFITQGPQIEIFEKTLAQYTEADYAVVFSSGTAALQAAYFAADIKAGDEIIISPLTFAATANAVFWQSGRPVFADIEEDAGNINPKEVEKKITKKTKVITAVDYAGLPAKLDELKQIAEKNKLLLVEDAAHALGAFYKGKKIGGISDMTIFSFHPLKSITAGEGGAVTANNKYFYERLKIFRNHGITKERSKLQNKNDNDWYYEMQELGLNYRLTDIQCALGRSQLKKINKFIEARQKIAKHYNEAFKNTPNFILPKETEEARSSRHLYPIRVAGKLINKRDDIFKKMRQAGIGVQVHYIPVYLHPYYQKLGYKAGLCPKAEVFFRTELSLPIFPKLKLKEQQYIIRKLKELISKL